VKLKTQLKEKTITRLKFYEPTNNKNVKNYRNRIKWLIIQQSE